MFKSVSYLTPFSKMIKGAGLEMKPDCLNVALLGVPFDYGVHLVGGRVGAQKGPEQLHNYLVQHLDLARFSINLLDLGTIECIEKKVEATHERVSQVVQELVKNKILPILIGGGHDISYAGIAGLAAGCAGNLGGINIDAHFDVREVIDGKISSGTPFRRVLTLLNERIKGSNFVEFGINNKFDQNHKKFLDQINANLFLFDDIKRSGVEKSAVQALNQAGKGTEHLFLSIDIDALSEQFAPGCSAPQSHGFSLAEVCSAVRILADHPELDYIDLMEINPLYDQEQKTLQSGLKILETIFETLSQRKKA